MSDAFQNLLKHVGIGHTLVAEIGAESSPSPEGPDSVEIHCKECKSHVITVYEAKIVKAEVE